MVLMRTLLNQPPNLVEKKTQVTPTLIDTLTLTLTLTLILTLTLTLTLTLIIGTPVADVEDLFDDR